MDNDSRDDGAPDPAHTSPREGAAPLPLMYSFGPFQLFPSRRTLQQGTAPVALGSRAFDILSLLVEQAGRIVGKDQLIARAWPHTCVEEANLRVHVSALRKALGEERSGCRYIDSIAGRGYSFIVPVTSHAAPPLASAHVASAPDAAALQQERPPEARSPRLIGRDETLDQVAVLLGAHRLVSIVGPGGMGKTSLALAVADRLAPGFPDGVTLVDLSSVPDPALVASALASALRLPVMSGQPLEAILSYLRERRLLLVLDNCEHLLEHIATLADAILERAPLVRLLATSRESLRVELERVIRLPSLTFPPPDAPDAPVEDYSALRLFAERAAVAFDHTTASADQRRMVADICRRLDGIPLAIELAAARVELLGIDGLAAALDDSLAILTRNRRSAAPRHQTLRAVLDWSYALLEEDERRMLQAVSVFRGTFTLRCARALADPAQPAAALAAAEAVLSLASKSMLACEPGRDGMLYRMLETTRSYGAEVLAASGDAAATQRRHALRCLELAGAAEADWDQQDTPAWMQRYHGRMADIRAALDWCFGTQGDSQLGLRLLTGSSLMWIELSLLNEQRSWIVRALPHCTDQAIEQGLLAALGNALFHLNGPHQEAINAFARSYELARALGDVVEQARTYSGLCANYLLNGAYPAALALGQEFAPFRHLSNSPVADIIYDRMMSLTQHFCGDQRAARQHAERVFHTPVRQQRNTRNSGVQYDQRVAAATALARIRWVEGYPEEAMAMVQEAVRRALDIEHPISLCYALSVAACPVALWNGDLARARDYIDLLIERAGRHSLVQWQRSAMHFDALDKGDPHAGTRGQRIAPGITAETLYTLAPAIAGPAEFARVEQGLAGWCAAELLRQQAHHVLAHAGDADQAEALLEESLAIAQRQQALAWQLRSATSLALLRPEGSRSDHACVLLEAVLARFSEGRQTRDQLAAAALLASRQRR